MSNIDNVKLEPIELTDNAQAIFDFRYNKSNLTPTELLWNMCKHVASAEEIPLTESYKKARPGDTIVLGVKTSEWTYKFYYELIQPLRFLPNSPTIVNGGNLNLGGGLQGCTVVNPDDTLESIFQTIKEWALILKYGAGVGGYFGHIRPKNDHIATTHGQALGPVAIMEILSIACRKVTQGHFREGALMAILPIDHPDIREFIHCKDNCKLPTDILANFNISVSVPDTFMQSIQDNKDWPLQNPRDSTVTEIVKAQDLWNEICESAWKTGDPGIFFIDRVRETEPNPQLGLIQSTNPCLLSSTRMLTKDGLMQISNIKNKNSIFYTPNGWSLGSAWKTGKKEVVNVILSNGQSIVTTPDHNFILGEDYEEAQHLQGYQLNPFLGKGDWVGLKDFDDITLIQLGFIQGDGTLINTTLSNGYKDQRVYVHIGKNDNDVERYFTEYSYHGNKDWSRYIPYNDPLVDQICNIGMDWSPLTERILPNTLWYQSPSSIRLFLKGLYSANGSVLENYHRISFKSSNLKLVREIQIILLALGFRPYITTNKPYEVEWPNGTYISKQSYDLNIAGYDMGKFLKDIGFIQTYKNQAITRDLSSYVPTNRRNLPKVIAVEPIGVSEVWDFNVYDESHIGWANGFFVSNCGEEPLENYGSCNLGSINLAKHIKTIHGESTISEDKIGNWPVTITEVDFDLLKTTVKLAVRFLDNVITVNQFPSEVPQLRERNLQTRRIGLGVMGWADMLALMGIPYDSDRAVDLARTLSAFITEHAWKASVELAKEKGAFPEYQNSKLKTALEFSKAKHDYSNGPRNSSVTTVAPTGSISLLAGCSSGIEPYPALSWERKTLWREGTPQVILQEYPAPLISRFIGARLGQQAIKSKSTPEGLRHLIDDQEGIFKTAHEISVTYHIKHQAAWQSGITSGVSKTINVPEGFTSNAIGGVYYRSWEEKCKGVTVYRDHSKDIQVIDTPRKGSNFILGRGYRDQEIQKSTLEVLGIGPLERPRRLSGETIKIKTGHGNVYITINSQNNKPFEVFVNLGKAGSCDSAQEEAISRLITLALRSGINIEEIIPHLQGITCCPFFDDGRKVLSTPDAIAYALKDNLGKVTISEVGIFAPNDLEFSQSHRCRKCDSFSVIFEENCWKCYTCGDSQC